MQEQPTTVTETETAVQAEKLAPVFRLRPIRTLVISRDLEYKDRALNVISELGPTAFAIGTLTDPRDLMRLIEAENAHVIVLDATDCERDVARMIAKLVEPLPRVGVVVVCHHCTDDARKISALPKWGWTQDLRDNVERAYGEGNPLRPRPVDFTHGEDAGQSRRALRPLSRH